MRHTLSISGASGLTVTIQGETENGYDYIKIYSSNGTEVGSFSGTINETLTVSGSSIRAVLTSDGSVTRSGVTVSISSGGNNQLSTTSLITPANGFHATTSSIAFRWNPINNATNYRIVISQDSSFSDFIEDGTSSFYNNGTGFTRTTPSRHYTKDSFNLSNHTYYWHVRGENDDGVGPWTETRSFTTPNISNTFPTSQAVDNFVDSKLNTSTDVDRAYGAQCVDLMRIYIQEVLGIPVSQQHPTGHAIQIYDRIHGSVILSSGTHRIRLDKIANTPTGIPHKGDIIFFRQGVYGHVAIFINGDANSFTSIDQNWGRGANSTTGLPARIVTHNYVPPYAVAGWLRPVLLHE